MEGPLEHVSFPHLTDFEWDALERLSAVSGQSFVVTLLRSASPDEQRTAIHEFLTRVPTRRKLSRSIRRSTAESAKTDSR
ncbi:hypothetical protein V7S43_009324 [Phytophthora oleae]|uniref:Uncharacterized protein n=1 Tax=Phytophthora oleae TaxID=2107226 RepID=A0ABD3FHK1_9STRA